MGWKEVLDVYKLLTLIQPGKGRFTLAYMSPDYLHGSLTGLSGWIRVNQNERKKVIFAFVLILSV